MYRSSSGVYRSDTGRRGNDNGLSFAFQFVYVLAHGIRLPGTGFPGKEAVLSSTHACQRFFLRHVYSLITW